MKTPSLFKRGQAVRSVYPEKPYTYRVLRTGPKRTTVSKTEGGYFRCTCPTSDLQPV